MTSFLGDMGIVMFDSKSFLKNLTTGPGVYQMFNEREQVIYVGKANNLKQRLSSYFRKTNPSSKTLSLVSQIANIEVLIVHSEQEALMLEYNFIKQFKPRYNVLLRDDKSYPYIVLTDHLFPRLMRYRSLKKLKGKNFGPYPQSAAAGEAVDFLQKIFKLRSCRDSFFRSRSRPCLQYQIHRCTAPCVNYITPEAYAEDVQHAELFLSGKSDQLIKKITGEMEWLSKAKRYEEAAKYRDQIKALREVQVQQYVNLQQGEADVLVLVNSEEILCFYLLIIRQGRVLGHKTFFLHWMLDESWETLITHFLTQYYLSSQEDIPSEILLTHPLKEIQSLQAVISHALQRSIHIKVPKRGQAMKWIDIAESSAQEALKSHLLKVASMQKQCQALQEILELSELPRRIECFDISHTMGEATIASCVVFHETGPMNQEYRRFNIEGVAGGDDVAAMKQVLTRRYTKVSKDKLPNIIIIDGGKMQLHQAERVLAFLNITNVILLSVAKGEGRKPGLETIYLSPGDRVIPLASDSIVLHLIQRIRDEAHRFAITGHRKRREKMRHQSMLEDIEGIGSARRLALLKHFGGLQGVLRASRDELAKVEGISKELAKRLYEVLH